MQSDDQERTRADPPVDSMNANCSANPVARPVYSSPPTTQSCRRPPVRTRVLTAVEVAVLTHPGTSHTDIDRSYGELGTYVTEHLISHQGPIREHYLGAEPGHFARFDRTEICWPIFGNGQPCGGETPAS